MVRWAGRDNQGRTPIELVIGLIIFAVDVYAIAKVINSGAETPTKVVWVLIIALLPVLGVIAWYVAGPK